MKIENGTCHGDLPLRQVSTAETDKNSDIAAGFYEVRAYTRYMLNWDISTLFSRVFPVYNKPAFPGDYTTRMTAPKELLPKVRPETKKQKKVNVSFYPEGGYLVKGIPCKIAYLITDEYGNSLNAPVTLTQSNGELTDRKCLHEGMGYLEYIPEERKK